VEQAKHVPSYATHPVSISALPRNVENERRPPPDPSHEQPGVRRQQSDTASEGSQGSGQVGVRWDTCSFFSGMALSFQPKYGVKFNGKGSRFFKYMSYQMSGRAQGQHTGMTSGQPNKTARTSRRTWNTRNVAGVRIVQILGYESSMHRGTLIVAEFLNCRLRLCEGGIVHQRAHKSQVPVAYTTSQRTATHKPIVKRCCAGGSEANGRTCPAWS
jgi:hypothetical protein